VIVSVQARNKSTEIEKEKSKTASALQAIERVCDVRSLQAEAFEPSWCEGTSN